MAVSCFGQNSGSVSSSLEKFSKENDEVFEIEEEESFEDIKKVVKEERSVSHCGNEVIKKTVRSFSQSGSQDDKKSIEEEKLSQYGKKSMQKVLIKKCEVGSKSEVSIQSVKSNGRPAQSVLVELFEKVYRSGLPNYKGCRISLPFNKLNIPLWRELLADYKDYVVCDFLEFGFPLDFDKSVNLSVNERRNHKGARDFPEFVNRYLCAEVEKSRIAGPFQINPLSIPIMVSPLNSVPKQSSDERRVIVDLSWPLGEGSVNSGISKEFYLQEKIESHYASVEEVCQMVLEIGKGALIYKRDLRQAYRQFRVDPADYYLLGYFWNSCYYFDTVLAMGQRNAGVGCSRVANAIMFIHSKNGYCGTCYLDDLIGVSQPFLASDAYNNLGTLLHQLGLEENMPKGCPPAVSQTVLGVVINTETMTISVTEERMIEINDLLFKWKEKKTCNKKELPSIIGKLAYTSRSVSVKAEFF